MEKAKENVLCLCFTQPIEYTGCNFASSGDPEGVSFLGFVIIWSELEISQEPPHGLLKVGIKELAVPPVIIGNICDVELVDTRQQPIKAEGKARTPVSNQARIVVFIVYY